jgi:SAM-dependent methyltransferase
MRTHGQQRPVHHPLFARVYARVGHLMDAEIGDHRRRLLAGLTGRVLAAASQAPVPIRVVAGTADALPIHDGALDAVVASLVLCTVADLERALAKVRRVLRPGGRLRFYEHVRATDPRLTRWQDRLERPWGWLVGGCHPNRDTVAAITAAGLQMVQLDRFDLPAMPPPARPHVLGVAEREP